VNAEHAIDGRKCEAKFALPEGKVGSARTTRIFVARIPASLSDSQFRQYFEQVRLFIVIMPFVACLPARLLAAACFPLLVSCMRVSVHACVHACSLGQRWQLGPEVAASRL
jgi:hypothetical protein